MDPAITNYVLQSINRCSHMELSSLQLTEIRKMAMAINIPTASKRKDALIEEISRNLSNSILRSSSCFSHIARGFPIINPDLDYCTKHPMFRRIIDKYNEMTANNHPFAFAQHTQLANQRAPILNYLNLFETFGGMNPNHARLNTNTFIPPQQPKKKLTNMNCVCGLAIYADCEDPLIKCCNPECGRMLHAFCMRIKPGSEEARIFECPDCTLKCCDPLHEIMDILRQPFRVDHNKQEFMVDQNHYYTIKSDESVGIEIRCIRIEEKSHEQTWPHQGELYINNIKELEFKPLQQNSSLKKRKDEKFFSRQVICGLNNLCIKYIPKTDPQKGKNQEGETYFAGIYLVRKLSCEQLIAKVRRGNVRNIENCKVLVKEQFRSGDIEIDRLSYPLTCVLDMQVLKTPAKGLHCRHVNCFSLENFINVWYKNNQRKWLCPICKTKSYDITVDAYFQNILSVAKEKGVLDTDLPEVTINSNAEFFLNVNEKDLKSKKSNDNQMIPEVADMSIKTEASKTSSNGIAKKENNKNAVTIILDSDEEDDPSPKIPPATINKQPVQTTSPPVVNLHPVPQQIKNNVNPKKPEIGQNGLIPEHDMRNPFEEYKRQIEPRKEGPIVYEATSMPKEQIRPLENIPISLQHNTDPNLASLRDDIQHLANPNIHRNVKMQIEDVYKMNPFEMVFAQRSMGGMPNGQPFGSLSAQKSAGKMPLHNSMSDLSPISSRMDIENAANIRKQTAPFLRESSNDFGNHTIQNLLSLAGAPLGANISDFDILNIFKQNQNFNQVRMSNEQLVNDLQMNLIASHNAMASPPIQAQMIELELTPLQKERKELWHSMHNRVEDLDSLLSTSKSNLLTVMEYADRDGELLTYDNFVAGKQRKLKKSRNYPIATKKKLLKLFYKFFHEDLKPPSAKTGTSQSKRKNSGSGVIAPSTSDKEKDSRKMKPERSGNVLEKMEAETNANESNDVTDKFMIIPNANGVAMDVENNQNHELKKPDSQDHEHNNNQIPNQSVNPHTTSPTPNTNPNISQNSNSSSKQKKVPKVASNSNAQSNATKKAENIMAANRMLLHHGTRAEPSNENGSNGRDRDLKQKGLPTDPICLD